MSNYLKLNKSSKLLLSIEDIASLLSISKESAKVTAVRYKNKGFLTRIKKDLYILRTKFEILHENELYKIANLIQTPSYISLTTALSFYNITTQQQINYIESIASKRSKTVNVEDVEFSFTLIKDKLYNGFIRENDFFIALPDKAFSDSVYLTSLGKYNCDFEAIDFSKINKSKVEQYLKNTNDRTKNFWTKLCKTYKI